MESAAEAIQSSASEQRQQLLLQAAGLGQRTLLPQQPGTQDHRIEITVEIERPLEAAAQIVGGEGVGGTLIHGLAGQDPGAG